MEGRALQEGQMVRHQLCQEELLRLQQGRRHLWQAFSGRKFFFSAVRRRISLLTQSGTKYDENLVATNDDDNLSSNPSISSSPWLSFSGGVRLMRKKWLSHVEHGITSTQSQEEEENFVQDHHWATIPSFKLKTVLSVWKLSGFLCPQQVGDILLAKSKRITDQVFSRLKSFCVFNDSFKTSLLGREAKSTLSSSHHVAYIKGKVK